jgi:hypothetical protein
MRFLARIFGRGGRGATAPAPLLSATETELRRQEAMARWQEEKRRLGGVSPRHITRRDVAMALRQAGWNREIREGEALHLRTSGGSEWQVRISLRGNSETTVFPPTQLLELHGSLIAAGAEGTEVHLPIVRAQGFYLTEQDISAAISEMEVAFQRMQGIDPAP